MKAIGFVGTGAITEAMVHGLLAKPAYVSEIHLSPRNAETAARLAAKFDSVAVASENQTVVDHSDIVVLAIRPQIAESVIRELRFRDGQSIVSVVATLERQSLLDWIGADVDLVQAIPLPFVADRQGVTAIYPADREIAALFDALGAAIQCESRKEYDLLAAASAMMSTFFGVMEFTTEWLEKNGLHRSKGQAYIAPLFTSLAVSANLLKMGETADAVAMITADQPSDRRVAEQGGSCGGLRDRHFCGEPRRLRGDRQLESRAHSSLVHKPGRKYARESISVDRKQSLSMSGHSGRKLSFLHARACSAVACQRTTANVRRA
ncbi:pyrroline-5-carboxylate reductase [Rhizobium leucaenae]|uniref:Pyrroline-5-carboxylate reductase n=1 Tax=Rhizobium leucaenae TaxID=29450 RepID=A0A7W6ZZ40_9HYPH|nr:pyrroline-5-carboxylate reductase [Rhizobium leucaenae]MBB6303650.1 pyrroline-5-carboxylate reductase [Rhizobium leucaenae]